ncbi:MAG TPA: NAD(P)-binding domain-containing protein [Gammaproteobacteria bacterium]|nr:NAD(P)-binding domain-containing protein [Gammaproteobacteria bacterium]
MGAQDGEAGPAEVCVIGAGSSGIAVAKALKERGISFDCFELGSDTGGNWRYGNDNGLSSSYRSLHIDTSRKNLQYSDFPIPEHLPDFMSHWQVMEYLDNYVDHFGVRPHIRFNTKVEEIKPTQDGGWDVRLGNGEIRRYRAVIAANGHLSEPRYPDFPGTFHGTQSHSHAYKTADPFEGKDVLVVGIGNSAVDIAVDVCRRANSVHLSTRRSAWIMPKYIMGIPTDRWSAFLARKLGLPTWMARAIISKLMYLTVGNQERYGVPKPQHPMWREHATLSQELLPHIGHGWIQVKPNVQELRGDKVVFVDGSEIACDAIIYATGYKTHFPFLDPALFDAEQGAAALYRRMAAPKLPGLYFAGLIQPIGATIPLVEIQAKWLAGVLAGEIKLPRVAEMEAEIARHQAAIRKQFVNSPRYLLEVDFKTYAGELRKDMGEKRAGLFSGRLPTSAIRNVLQRPRVQTSPENNND